MATRRFKTAKAMGNFIKKAKGKGLKFSRIETTHGKTPGGKSRFLSGIVVTRKPSAPRRRAR